LKESHKKSLDDLTKKYNAEVKKVGFLKDKAKELMKDSIKKDNLAQIKADEFASKTNDLQKKITDMT
jgi:hypothetical protein